MCNFQPRSPSSDPEHILINSNNDEEDTNGSGNNGESSRKYNEDIGEDLDDRLFLTADNEDRKADLSAPCYPG